MKILQINTERSWRGGERQTLWVMMGLRRHELDCELIARANGLLARRARSEGFSVHPVAYPGQTYWFLRRFGKRYDIIHAQTARGHNAAVYAAPAHRRPVVYTRRVDFAPKGYIKRHVYLRTDHVIAISAAIRDILRQFCSVPITVIPSIVTPMGQTGDLRSWLRGLGIDAGRKKILATTAALVRHKDPFTLLRALARLASMRNDFLFLHFGAGYLESEIDSLAKQYQLQGIYYRMGFVPGVESFFSQFDLFVLTSRMEGLGSSVLDAFLYRVPVVSTDAGGLAETVNGRGSLCRSGDDKCLAETIDRILSDPATAQSAVESAYQHVLQVHSPERSAREHVNLYKSVLSM